ncbi:MAG: UDP-N-acetylmuramate dehydrogenase [Acidobacteria bacterium]|nr:UDP-N-acetylmuramate dehydrogenase [Acidobacteriota bacterium]
MDASALSSIPGVKPDIQLRDYSWFRIGGKADYFYTARNIDSLREVLGAAYSLKVPCFFLGGGSNILFSDKGFRGLVIKNELKGQSFDGQTLIAQSGNDLGALIKAGIENKLGGWEGLYGIPGTLGGAVRGNVGAYGHEISQDIRSVVYLDNDLNEKKASVEDLRFRYRYSFFKENGFFILSATLHLEEVDAETSREKINELLSIRNSRHPSRLTAGCFFQNPKEYGVPAARLIEEAGLKGKTIGGASISDKHSNFIINSGNASAEDVLRLADFIKEEVFKKNGVLLKEEVQVVPEVPTIN